MSAPGPRSRAPTRLKFCGLTRLSDAQLAVELGAWAVGFVFYPGSPRAVSAEQAAHIIERLPPGAVPVGVFVNASPERIEQTARVAGLGLAQLHGDETPDWINKLSLPVMRAFRPAAGFDPAEARAWGGAQAWLVDAAVEGAYGGTGARADWTVARELGRLAPRLVLAGGLNPDNVTEAVRAVLPYAVDVSSGVEDAPGIKNAQKMKDFARRVNEETAHETE